MESKIMQHVGDARFSRAPLFRGSRKRQATVLVLCVLALAGCATTTPQEVRDQLIQQRAQARWDALLAGDYATAYGYASPGYRSSMSLTDFEIEFRSRRVQYTSVEYESHSCEEAVCEIRMRVGFKIDRPMQGLPEWSSYSVIGERWINTGGEWWFLPETG